MCNKCQTCKKTQQNEQVVVLQSAPQLLHEIETVNDLARLQQLREGQGGEPQPQTLNG